MPEARRRRSIAFGLAVVLSLVVLFTPGSDVPSGIPIDDKVIHAALFGLLAATGLAARLPTRWLLPALASYAVASEILQGALPISRDADWRDALADVIGIAVVALLMRNPRAR